MSAELIDGKEIAAAIQRELTQRVEALATANVRPGLGVILVGSDPASLSYVTAKENDCAKVGIASCDIRLPSNVSANELLCIIADLNADPAIHGILVQLPLPSHIDEESIINTIDPAKDVDGFHPVNMGRLVLGLEGFIPCTPHGIIKMLEYSGVQIAGSDVVVLGRSRIVGAPLANLLFRKAAGGNATVTICHTRTVDLADKVRRADLVIAAAGRPNTITGEIIKPGAVVIDVGVNRVDDASRTKGYRLVGDVDFESARKTARLITPVPGGVGPMTRAMLLWNVVVSCEWKLRQ